MPSKITRQTGENRKERKRKDSDPWGQGRQVSRKGLGDVNRDSVDFLTGQEGTRSYLCFSHCVQQTQEAWKGETLCMCRDSRCYVGHLLLINEPHFGVGMQVPRIKDLMARDECVAKF